MVIGRWIDAAWHDVDRPAKLEATANAGASGGRYHSDRSLSVYGAAYRSLEPAANVVHRPAKICPKLLLVNVEDEANHRDRTPRCQRGEERDPVLTVDYGID